MGYFHHEKNGPFATSLATRFSSYIGHLELGVFCTPLVLRDKLHESHWTNYIVHHTKYKGDTCAIPHNYLRLKNSHIGFHAKIHQH
jgi:hypothetical protein